MTTADQHYLPPAPLGAPLDSVAWAEWYRKLREVAESGQQSLDNLTNTVEPELQNKLNKNAADVLGGEITFSSLGAFKVGNVTWNGSTVTGTGLLFSQYGIVGALNNSPKFVLKADGSATFGGQLTAATGTFSGQLTAATGTFSGQLTAATGTFGGQLTAATGTFNGSLTVGSSPAISGTTMTGSGAVINSNGTFALGNSTGNITYNGSTVTLNGDVVSTSNISNTAVTELRYKTDTGSAVVANASVTMASQALPTYSNAPTAKVLISYSVKFINNTATNGFASVRVDKNGTALTNPVSGFEQADFNIPANTSQTITWQCVDESPSSGATYSLQFSPTVNMTSQYPRISLILFKK